MRTSDCINTFILHHTQHIIESIKAKIQILLEQKNYSRTNTPRKLIKQITTLTKKLTRNVIINCYNIMVPATDYQSLINSQILSFMLHRV
jgi:ethanolamine utilization protein EutA (predicted chaperonin)